MGLTKKELFNEDQNRLAEIAKVLAHPARIAILEYLLNSDTCINGDLVQELGLSQPTISQHLRELRDLGIIKGSIEGVTVCYCIDREKWNEIRTTFNQLFQRVQSPNDSCC